MADKAVALSGITKEVSTPEPTSFTGLLLAWGDGDEHALDQMVPFVYEELRRLAASYLRRERANHTLQSTALVHEAYMRLVDQRQVKWQNRAHFFGIAAQVIRRILVDHARGHQAQKRGAGAFRLSLEDAPDVAAPAKDLDLTALDDALTRLGEMDPQQAKIVELRFFGGLSIEETATALKISPATVKRDWAVAKAWLFRELKDAV